MVDRMSFQSIHRLRYYPCLITAGSSECTQDCKGPCSMRCEAADCESTCTGGKCSLECSNSESRLCEQSCAHGACEIKCSAVNCESTCAGGDCFKFTCTADNCTQHCGRNCTNMRCQAKQQCSQTCTKGGCNMYCETGADMCVMSCPGGNCKLQCDGTSCKRDCSGGGCEKTGSGREVVAPTSKPPARPKGSGVGAVAVNLPLLLFAIACLISACDF